MKTTQTYRVYITGSFGFTVELEASSNEEAERIALSKVSGEGFDWIETERCETETLETEEA